MFGEHAAFIIPSYLISFAALAIAVLVIWRTYHVRLAELRKLETKRDANS